MFGIKTRIKNFFRSVFNPLPLIAHPEMIQADLQRLAAYAGYFPCRLLKGPANDYRLLERELPDASFCPSKRASVVVAMVDRDDRSLEKTLAALFQQTYPKDHFEIIVLLSVGLSKPGSLARFHSERLAVKFLRTSPGERACAWAGARNQALHVATGDVVIFMESGVVPIPRLVQSFMRWFHGSDDWLFVIGTRLTADGFLSDDGGNPDVRAILAEKKIPRFTRGSAFELSDPQSAITHFGNPFAVRKHDLQEIGGYDHTIEHVVGSQIELNYRFLRRGAYFVPEPDAAVVVDTTSTEATTVAAVPLCFDQLADKVPPFRRISTLSLSRRYSVPKVSVYMPAYNCGKYIVAAVNSVLAQTFQDWELCICDDGSTDDTPNVLERHFKNEPRVRWCRQTNQGISAASNAAIQMTRGQYIAQLDSDDRFRETALAELVAFMEQQPEYGLVYSGFAMIDEANEIIGRRLPPHMGPRVRQTADCQAF